MKVIITLFFLLLLQGFCWSQLIVNSPEEVKNVSRLVLWRFENTPTNWLYPPYTPVKGLMAVASNPASYGNIVITRCPPFSVASAVQNIMETRLPKAIIVVDLINFFPGADWSFQEDWEITKKWKIPVGGLDFYAGNALLQLLEDNTTTADVEAIFSENPWQTSGEHPAWWIISGAVALGGVAAFFLALIKLIQFIKAFGLTFSLAQVTLLIQIVINPMLLGFWIGSTGYTMPSLMSLGVGKFTEQTVPTIAVTVCLFLSTFFWHELMLTTNIRVNPFISKFKIPALIVVILCLCMVYISSVIFGVGLQSPDIITRFSNLKWGIDMALNGISSIYSITIGIIVLKKLQGKNSSTIRKVTIQFIVIGCLQLVRMLGISFFLNQAYPWTDGYWFLMQPYVFRMGFWLQYAAMITTNILLVTGFTVPKSNNPTKSEQTQ